MRCTWNKKLIFKLYQNPTIRDELSGLLLTYFEMLDTIINTRYPIKRMLDLDATCMKENLFIEDIIDEFISKIDFMQNANNDFNVIFSKDDVLALTACFYNSLEPDFQNAFAKIYAKRNDCLRFISPVNTHLFAGSTFHSPTADETFIASKYNKTFASITTLIHEYAHAISFQLNKDKSIEVQDQIFSEIESIFMELVALDFFEKNYSNLRLDINTSRLILYNTAIEDAIITHYKILFIKVLKEKGISINEGSLLRIINHLKNESGLPLSDILYTFNIPLDTICKYPIGTLIAIELYNIYKQNPQEAFNLYRNIICFNDLLNSEIYEKLKKMGINPPSHLETFEKKLTRN